jgi:hypothetical protein
MTCQPIPKFSTTLNGHPVFIPAMVWHIPPELLVKSISALRTIDKQVFDGFGVCHAASFALFDFCRRDAYKWIAGAMTCYDHESGTSVDKYLKGYFRARFGLREFKHYYHEDITALRLEWLAHIIAHLEEAAK